MNLPAEGKARTAAMTELPDIFAVISLPPQRVEKQVKPTGDKDHQSVIQRQNHADPAE